MSTIIIELCTHQNGSYKTETNYDDFGTMTEI